MRALAIETGLIRGDHAGIQLRLAPAGQADRPLMHVQAGTDAMAGAVIIIESRPPERDTCQGIEFAPLYPLRKTGAAERDHALQDKREMPPMFVRYGAGREGPRDVGGSVIILGTGI